MASPHDEMWEKLNLDLEAMRACWRYWVNSTGIST
jgi:hypothetical protein